MGERLVDGEYVPYDTNVEPDGSVWSRSEALCLNFYWDGEYFDIRDPLTGKTINPVETEPQTRLEAEAQSRRLMAENERLRRGQSGS